MEAGPWELSQSIDSLIIMAPMRFIAQTVPTTRSGKKTANRPLTKGVAPKHATDTPRSIGQTLNTEADQLNTEADQSIRPNSTPKKTRK